MNQAKSHAQTVLLVEDELPFRQIYRDTLQMEGFKIIETESGEEALAALEKQLPDVILLDLILPQMSGYDVLAHVKNNPQYSHIPVVVYSVIAEKDKIDRAMKLGASGYTIKGLTPAIEVANKVKSFAKPASTHTSDASKS